MAKKSDKKKATDSRNVSTANVVKTTKKTKEQLDLEKKNLELEKKLSALMSLQDQMNELVAENKRLRERSQNAEKKEKYVGVRSTIDGDIWLPSPESMSGSGGGSNGGMWLLGHKSVVIPSYWAANYIVSKSPTFLSGNAVFDNEAGKKVNPGVEFADLDLPDEFIAAGLVAEKLKDLFLETSSDRIIEFIDSLKDNKIAINKIYAHAKSVEEKYKGKHKIVVEQVLSYLEDGFDL